MEGGFWEQNLNLGRTKVLISCGITMSGLFMGNVYSCEICSFSVMANPCMCETAVSGFVVRVLE